MFVNWTADGVLTAISAGLSLFFAYFPGVKTWYDGLDERIKPLIQLGLIVALVGGRLLWVCNFQGACISANLTEAGLLLLACLTANNMTFQHAVKQFKKAKAAPAAPPPPAVPAPVEKQ